MVRTEDIHEGLASMEMPDWGPTTPVTAPPLSEARIALISTAGLKRTDVRPFLPGANDFRVLPGDLDFADLQLSHVSVNFDRSGYQQDPNIAFPLERLREMEANGEIGSVAKWHYSFMGATDPSRMVETAPQVARLLKEDNVTAAILVPI